jgi:NAD(P)-dependent dehydrogenase (short-subunit alcohol dehydrogenase family)
VPFPPLTSKNVLITGCSSGIGLATALRLQERGWDVIPTARGAEDISALQRRGFAPLVLDMADSESVRRAAVDALARFSGRPGALVNNAGYGLVGALEDLSRVALRHQFEVNVFGALELANLVLPAMIEQGRGRIVNVSSVLGRVCMPFRAAYSASKFALEALSDGLRVELRQTGVAVCLIEPGPIATRFQSSSAGSLPLTVDVGRSRHAQLYEEKFQRPDLSNPTGTWSLPPDAVARKIEHALLSARPRRRYPVTLQTRAGEILRRLSPDAFSDWIISRIIT